MQGARLARASALIPFQCAWRGVKWKVQRVDAANLVVEIKPALSHGVTAMRHHQLHKMCGALSGPGLAVGNEGLVVEHAANGAVAMRRHRAVHRVHMSNHSEYMRTTLAYNTCLAPVIGSQNATVSDNVATHAWGTSTDGELPRLVPPHTNALRPNPSSRLHNSTAWSSIPPLRCAGSFRNIMVSAVNLGQDGVEMAPLLEPGCIAAQ